MSSHEIKPDLELARLGSIDRESKVWLVKARVYWRGLLIKLRRSHWYSYSTRSYFNDFLRYVVEGKRGIVESAQLLSETIDELSKRGDSQSLERLRVHVNDSKVAVFENTRTLAPIFARLDPRSATAKVDYVFKAAGEYTLAGIDKLPPARKRQFLVAAKKFLPGRYARPRAFFEAFARDGDTTIDGLTATCWRIARAQKPKAVVYEMWTFLVDNGTVFPVGKHTPVGIEMIQGKLRATKPTTALRALAEDLDRAVPF